MKIKDKELSLKIYRQYKNRRYLQLLTFVLILTLVMFFQIGCSLFGYFKIERYLGTNSICWEDNDHILIYASIAQYHDIVTVGGSDRMYDWVGGEIWRITASTGAKELLFRSKDSHYVYSIEGVHMDAVNGHIYINDEFNIYKIVEPYDEWEQIIDSVVYPVVSDDEKYIVAMRHGGDAIKYDITNKTMEVLLTDAGPVSDYDFERNYLLINSNKFVDLNTGEEVVVIKYLDRIENYIVMKDPYRGKIEGDYITADLYLEDSITNENEFYKVVINLNDLSEKKLLHNISGYRSPLRNYYATPGAILDTLGNIINTFEFSEDEL